MVIASDRATVGFSLSGGQAHDAPEGIALLKKIRREKEQKCLLMDRAYEGENVRTAALEQGFEPVVPPKSSRRAVEPRGSMIRSATSNVMRLSGSSLD